MPVRDTQSQATVPDYKNPHLPVEQRVADLLSRMTLEEKVAQLTCLWQDAAAGETADGFFNQPRRVFA